MNISGFRRAFAFLKEYFFPSGCALCGTGLTGAVETWYGLCGSCCGTITPESGERCDLCGKPLISEHIRCLSCRNGENRSFDSVTVLFPYTGKYRQLLTAYKFAKNLALGNFFAEKILEAAGGYLSEKAVIVPVPPRPGKIKTAGWDQVEYLAKLLNRGGEGGIEIRRCLKRLKSKVQKHLTREQRMKNLQGRIVLKGYAPKIALLIDDVMTTGATLDVCAAALKQGGTEKVYGLCLFYD
jgi:ComF family protein